MTRILFTIILFFLVSCTNNADRKHIGSMAEVKSEQLDFEEIPIKPLLGSPYQLEILDSTLLIADRVDNKALALLNLSKNTFTRTLNIGQGPYDVLAPININVSHISHKVFILQRQDSKCLIFPIKELLQDSIRSFNSVKLEMSDRIVKTDKGYIGSGFYEDGLFCFFDDSGKPLSYRNIHTSSKAKNIAELYRLLQGRMAYNEHKSQFMFAPSYMSTIKFYSFKDNDITPIDSFSIGNGAIDKRVTEEGSYELHKNDIQGCIDVCYSKEYFYILYSGVELNKQKDATCRYILRFNSSGNLNAVYKVDPTLSNICVSMDDSNMYGIFLNDALDYVIGKATFNSNENK